MKLFRKTRTLRAINKLIVYYNIGVPAKIPRCYSIETARQCPLCALYKFKCGQCPWVLYEGATCSALGYSRHTTFMRLERLKRWKEKIGGK